MIPLKLQIKNFLSYGPDIQTIDFSGYPLICLSGKNGHGKSALLDAITWALWGYARKVSDTVKADEGLLRLGQTHMLVILDFEFNGTNYRVRREYLKTYGKPITNLDFGLLNSATEMPSPLTEKTLRATQAKIDALLNIHAEAFINSAFLRQGQSNEFSKKSSKERKEILASILGIDQYETLRKAAQEKTKEATIEKNSLLALQTATEQELKNKDSVLLMLSEVEKKLSDISSREINLRTEQVAIDIEKHALADAAQRLALLNHQSTTLYEEENNYIHELETVKKQWRSIHKKQLTQQNIAKLQMEQKNLSHQLSEYQQKLQKSLLLKETLLSLKEKIQQREQENKTEHLERLHAQKIMVDQADLERKSIQNTVNLMQQEIHKMSEEKNAFSAELKVAAQIIAHFHEQRDIHAAVEKQFEKRKEYYQQFIAQGNVLKTELAHLEQKKLLVHDDMNPSCPLCEQNLSASRKKFIKASFAKTEESMKHTLKRLSNALKKLKEVLITQHAEIVAIQQKRDLYNQTNLQQQALIAKIAQLETVLITTRERNTSLEKQLAVQETHYQKMLATLCSLEQALTVSIDPRVEAMKKEMIVGEQAIALLNYHAEEHQRVMQQLHALENALRDTEQLQHEIAQQSNRLFMAQELCNKIKKLRQTRMNILQEIATFIYLHEAQKNLIERQAKLSEHVQIIQSTKECTLQEKGKLESNHATLCNLEKECLQRSLRMQHLDETIEDYHIIAQATGKDGIQALLIEDAIPEIEQEANELLAKLTNNQAHMFIESVRDLKKGGTKETLDIKISDSLGIRPYEMFSGGEAFRIDFALRIAISKLLARRAGTSLQTLIIDEGFGSQDEEGLQYIMDALYTIQDDFAKIIIVSHLPTMKDQFPVHFFVEKGAQGSMVKVIEQG